MAPRSKINMNTIALELGVSKVTVSKALNDKDGVSEELREKIKNRAKELGYHINAFASGLKNNKTFNVGVLVPERYVKDTNTYYFEVYAKLAKKFSEYEYSSIMEVLTLEDENNLVYPKVFLSKKVDAIIIVGECKYEYLKLYEEVDIPVIFFDFSNSEINVDSISIDNYDAGSRITKLLIDAGHKDIGFIGSIYSTSSIKERYLGYYRALLDAHLEINHNFVLNDRDDFGNIIKIEYPKKMPTAWVCNNDQLAHTVVEDLIELGYKIPEDISIVSFDNTIYSKLSIVKLTTVDTNVDEMVDKVTKMIVKKLNDTTKVYGSALVKGFIVEGSSIKDIRR